MRKIILIGFIGLISHAVWSQNNEIIDSLKRILPPNENEQRYHILNAIAWEYRFAFPDSTIKYAQAAFKLGEELGLKKDLARPLNYMGIAYNYRGDRLLSIGFHKQAIELATKQNDSSQLAHANNSIGRVYYEQGMVQQSVDFYMAAQKTFENINDSSGIAYVYQSLGNLYRTQGDFKTAKEFYSKALAIRQKLGNLRDIMAATVLIGRLYQDHGQLDESNKYFLEATVLCKEIGDAILLAEIEILLSQNYLKQNKISEAEAIGLKAYQKVSEVKNVRMLPLATLTLGQIYLAKNQVNEARTFFLRALDVANPMRDAVSQRDAYYWLWKVAERSGKKSEAVDYQNKFLIMRDSTNSLELARQVDQLQFQLQMEKRQRENEQLKAVETKNEALIRQQRLENLVLIIAAFAGVTIMIVQRINDRKTKKINLQLAQTNQEIIKRNQQLSDLNNEKDTLMNIVVHDLKAPLNNIKGLSTLLELDGTLNQDQGKYLKMIKDSTQTGLEMITDLLDAHAIESGAEPALENINIKEFLENQLKAFSQAARAKEISIQLEVQDFQATTDKEYLSRILDNLVSNAIKFSPKQSVVLVKSYAESGNYYLCIKDHGQGFSEADKQNLYQKFKKLSARPTAGESSNGLGLAIVKILVDRLGGTISLESEPGSGSEFIVRVPHGKVA
jgi:signal transduction histidine kinase